MFLFTNLKITYEKPAQFPDRQIGSFHLPIYVYFYYLSKKIFIVLRNTSV